MFTGIITSVAKLRSTTVEDANLRLVFASSISQHLHTNQSVAHNGACLSILENDKHTHTVIAVAQTLQTTNLSHLKVNELVNLELSLRATDKLEGHYVQGHIDTLLPCLERLEREGSWQFTFGLSANTATQVVEKGSICLNGVSLTAYNVEREKFSVSVIPYTYRHTNFCQLQVGMSVNTEFDLIGKYVKRICKLGHKVN